jgi:hypothetical protein
VRATEDHRCEQYCESVFTSGEYSVVLRGEGARLELLAPRPGLELGDLQINSSVALSTELSGIMLVERLSDGHLESSQPYHMS